MMIPGSAMIVAGVLICVGVFERIAALVATVAMGVLIVLVVGNNPSSSSDLHGRIAKDLCLGACASVVWVLAGIEKEVKKSLDLYMFV